MTIMMGRMAIGRHGTGAIVESSHLDTEASGRESYLGMARAFESSKFTPPVTYLLQQDHTCLS